MNEEKKPRSQPTVLEAQQHINDADSRIREAEELHLRGEISFQRLEDEEQLAALSLARAQREREEAVDQQTGRRVGLRRKIGRKVSKFFIG